MATQTTNFVATNTPVDGVTTVTAASVSTDLLALINDYNLQIGSNKIAAGAVGTVQIAAGAVTPALMNATAFTAFASAATGVSSITTDTCRYIQLGKILFLLIEVVGVSNATTFTITLPFNALNTREHGGFLVSDNTTQLANPGRADTAASSATLTLFKDHTGAAWTASGSKAFRGSFFIETS